MTAKQQLKQIADRQCGYFTPSQAVKAGFAQHHHVYHVSHGNWEKAGRGLFRLPGYGDSLQSEFVKTALLVQKKAPKQNAAISHESALYYYGLTADAPGRTHVTLSAKRLPRTGIEGCELHLGELDWNEFRPESGFNITTPLRTLKDMKPDLLLARVWGETVRVACGKCLIDHAAADALLAQAPGYAGAVTGTREEIAMAENFGGHRHGAQPLSRTQPPRTPRSTWRSLAGDNRAFTLVELLVVVSIVTILASLLLPVLRNAANSAKGASCMNNQKQISLAATAYTDENAGWLLNTHWSGWADQGHLTSWVGRIQGYLGANYTSFSASRLPQATACPLSPKRFGYGVNVNVGNGTIVKKAGRVKKPSRQVYFCDSIRTTVFSWWSGSLEEYQQNFLGWNPYVREYLSADSAPNPAHSGGSCVNVGFFDGHSASTGAMNDLFANTAASRTAYWLIP